MPTRRSLLRRGTELATLSTLAALAGCTDALPGGGDGGDGGSGSAPDYAGALYDPSSLVDVGNDLFFSYDVGTVYGMRDRFPDRFTAQLDAAAAQAEGFDPADLDRVTGVAGASTTADGSDVGRAVGSVRLTGSFDAETLGEQVTAMGSLSSAGSHEGYDLYTSTMAEDGTAALALGGDAVYAGGASGADLDAARPVTAMIDAAAADGSGYYDASDPARRLLDRLSGSLSITGMTVDAAALEEQLRGDGGERNRMAESVVSGLRAAGTSTTLDGDTATSEVVLVYADGEAPASEDVEALADLATAQQGLGERFGEIAVDRSGSRVVLSAEQSTAALFERPDEALTLLMPGLAVVGAFFLGVGSTVSAGAGGGASGGGNVQAGTTVEFDEAADEVRVTYTSARDAEVDLAVRAVAETPDGGEVGAERVLAEVGDAATLSFPDGSTVEVVVRATDGENATVVYQGSGRL